MNIYIFGIVVCSREVRIYVCIREPYLDKLVRCLFSSFVGYFHSVLQFYLPRGIQLQTCKNVCLQICPVWRLHGHIHLLLLHLLLPCAVRHVRLHADILLLRLHDLRLLRLLPHAGHRRFPRIALLRAAHLPLHQVRVNCRSIKCE